MREEERRGEKRAYVDIIADGGDLLGGLLAEPVGARLVQNLIHAVSLCFLFSPTAGLRWEKPIKIVEISRARKGPRLFYSQELSPTSGFGSLNFDLGN